MLHSVLSLPKTTLTERREWDNPDCPADRKNIFPPPSSTVLPPSSHIPFNVREAVFMVFNADIPLSRVVSSFCPICCKNFPSAFLPPGAQDAAPPETGRMGRWGFAGRGGGLFPGRRGANRRRTGTGKFFPIVGKRPKNFSNHWKIRPDFSNHWKKIFQSLENFSVADGAADRAPPGRFQRKRGTDSPELTGTGRGFSASFHPKMDSMHSSRKTTGPATPPGGAVGCSQLWGSPFPWGQAVRKHGNFPMKTPLERENSKNGILELSLS